ncbi:MAG: transcription antitermination factor NusB [candidate division WOR-3 bacterium]|nr:MAG: transcription antitermination factor NusB [candidate division WOR-3 bacterium]
MGRRLARELAMKVLYRYEEGERDTVEVLANVLSAKHYQETDKEFCQQLVQVTVEHVDSIDNHIKHVIKNWPYDRISVIDKSILRIGTCELLFFDDIPAQVSINEAIEIGKRYGGADSGRFINGVLDAVRKEHESSDNK